MADDSTRPRRRRKTADRPGKPYPEFPLYAHPAGLWAARVGKRICYFGRWGRKRGGRMERVEGDGWEQALATYKIQIDDLRAGRVPRNVSNGEDGGMRLAELCNRFLTSKLRRVQSGELSPRTLGEYRETTDRLIAAFGKDRLVLDLLPDDFGDLRAKAAQQWGPVRLANFITRVKAVFNYADSNGLIERPVKYGSEFSKPSSETLRKHKATTEKRLFSAEEIHAMIEAADPIMRAAIYLGINAGLGNGDIAALQFSHLDLKDGWLDYPRPKSGVGRRVPLWRETVEAVKAAIEARSKPASDDDAQCVFLTPVGKRHVRLSEKARTDYLAHAFPLFMRGAGIALRKGRSFYSLRHTLASIGLQAKDRGAVKALLGQIESDVLAAYDETGPDDDRRRAVVDHVRDWLLTAKPKATKRKARSPK